MTKYQERIRKIERWIRFRTEDGFVIAKAQGARGRTYLVNGKRTNIQYATRSADRTFWFSVGFAQLNEMDIFIWLCEIAENYYAIPHNKMKKLATNWFSPTEKRFHFRLDTKNHKYIAHTRTNIIDYFQNLSQALEDL